MGENVVLQASGVFLQLPGCSGRRPVWWGVSTGSETHLTGSAPEKGCCRGGGPPGLVADAGKALEATCISISSKERRKFQIPAQVWGEWDCFL